MMFRQLLVPIFLSFILLSVESKRIKDNDICLLVSGFDYTTDPQRPDSRFDVFGSLAKFVSMSKHDYKLYLHSNRDVQIPETLDIKKIIGTDMRYSPNDYRYKLYLENWSNYECKYIFSLDADIMVRKNISDLINFVDNSLATIVFATVKFPYRGNIAIVSKQANECQIEINNYNMAFNGDILGAQKEEFKRFLLHYWCIFYNIDLDQCSSEVVLQKFKENTKLQRQLCDMAILSVYLNNCYLNKTIELVTAYPFADRFRLGSNHLPYMIHRGNAKATSIKEKIG